MTNESLDPPPVQYAATDDIASLLPPLPTAEEELAPAEPSQTEAEGGAAPEYGDQLMVEVPPPPHYVQMLAPDEQETMEGVQGPPSELPQTDAPAPMEGLQLPEAETQLPASVVRLPGEDAQLQATDALLPDLDAQLQETDAQLPDSDAQLQEIDAQLPDSDAQLQETDAQLPDSDAQLQEIGAQLPDSDAQLQETDAQPQETDAQLPYSDAQLQETGTQLPDPDAQLQETDAQLQETDAQLPYSDAQLQETDTQLPDPGAQLPEADAQLPEIDTQLQATYAQLQEVDAQLPALDVQLDAELPETDAQLPEVDDQLQSIDAQLPASYARLPETDAQLQATYVQLQATYAQLPAAGEQEDDIVAHDVQLPEADAQLPAAQGQEDDVAMHDVQPQATDAQLPAPEEQEHGMAMHDVQLQATDAQLPAPEEQEHGMAVHDVQLQATDAQLPAPEEQDHGMAMHDVQLQATDAQLPAPEEQDHGLAMHDVQLQATDAQLPAPEEQDHGMAMHDVQLQATDAQLPAADEQDHGMATHEVQLPPLPMASEAQPSSNDGPMTFGIPPLPSQIPAQAKQLLLLQQLLQNALKHTSQPLTSLPPTLPPNPMHLNMCAHSGTSAGSSSLPPIPQMPGANSGHQATPGDATTHALGNFFLSMPKAGDLPSMPPSTEQSLGQAGQPGASLELPTMPTQPTMFPEQSLQQLLDLPMDQPGDHQLLGGDSMGGHHHLQLPWLQPPLSASKKRSREFSCIKERNKGGLWCGRVIVTAADCKKFPDVAQGQTQLCTSGFLTPAEAAKAVDSLLYLLGRLDKLNFPISKDECCALDALGLGGLMAIFRDANKRTNHSYYGRCRVEQEGCKWHGKVHLTPDERGTFTSVLAPQQKHLITNYYDYEAEAAKASDKLLYTLGRSDKLNLAMEDDEKATLGAMGLGRVLAELCMDGHPNCISQYRGVSQTKQKNGWHCNIFVRDRSVQLGVFMSEKEAALAYDAAARCMGYFDQVNFPNEGTDLIPSKTLLIKLFGTDDPEKVIATRLASPQLRMTKRKRVRPRKTPTGKGSQQVVTPMHGLPPSGGLMCGPGSEESEDDAQDATTPASALVTPDAAATDADMAAAAAGGGGGGQADGGASSEVPCEGGDDVPGTSEGMRDTPAGSIAAGSSELTPTPGGTNKARKKVRKSAAPTPPLPHLMHPILSPIECGMNSLAQLVERPGGDGTGGTGHQYNTLGMPQASQPVDSMKQHIALLVAAVNNSKPGGAVPNGLPGLPSLPGLIPAPPVSEGMDGQAGDESQAGETKDQGGASEERVEAAELLTRSGTTPASTEAQKGDLPPDSNASLLEQLTWGLPMDNATNHLTGQPSGCQAGEQPGSSSLLGQLTQGLRDEVSAGGEPAQSGGAADAAPEGEGGGGLAIAPLNLPTSMDPSGSAGPEEGQNSLPASNATRVYPGVVRDSGGRWHGRTYIAATEHNLLPENLQTMFALNTNTFDTAAEAAKALDRLFYTLGRHDRLNFPMAAEECVELDQLGVGGVVAAFRREGSSRPSIRKRVSVYRGVTQCPSTSKKIWKGLITYKRRTVGLGSYDTEEEAARAYDGAARLLGYLDKLNFPEEVVPVDEELMGKLRSKLAGLDVPDINMAP